MSYWQRFKVMSYGGSNGRMSIPALPGVYVIYFNDRPVYAGQSANVRTRIGSHKFRFGYGRNIHTPWADIPDTVSVTTKVKITRRLGDWAMWEIRLIARLHPEFNTHHLKRRAA
jgi:hypothetical protein